MRSAVLERSRSQPQQVEVGVTVAEKVDLVIRDAERFRDTDSHVVECLSVGDIWWQGDCGIQYIAPRGLFAGDPVQAIQLADGKSEGSKHVARCPEGGTLVINRLSHHPLMGFRILARQGIEVVHPVHGDVTLKEPGIYLVRFQQQLVADWRGKLMSSAVPVRAWD